MREAGQLEPPVQPTAPNSAAGAGRRRTDETGIRTEDGRSRTTPISSAGWRSDNQIVRSGSRHGEAAKRDLNRAWACGAALVLRTSELRSLAPSRLVSAAP